MDIDTFLFVIAASFVAIVIVCAIAFLLFPRRSSGIPKKLFTSMKKAK
ncbi:MAG: hypothetical protein AAGF28_02705 [Pseudomonadota bacterium]